MQNNDEESNDIYKPLQTNNLELNTIRSSNIKKEFGKMFKKLRKSKKITQEELAESLSIERTTVVNWETGKSFITDLSLIVDIHKITGIYIVEVLDMAVRKCIEKKRN
jgi:DNA-binding XRE family transcriptional regulator